MIASFADQMLSLILGYEEAILYLHESMAQGKTSEIVKLTGTFGCEALFREGTAKPP